MKIGPFQITLTRQQVPQAVRRFDGAAGGRRAGGVGTFGPINAEVGAAGATLRARSRHLVANNPLVSSGVRNLATALTGAGIMPAPLHPDAATRKALMTVWRGWCDLADASGRTDFAGLQAQIARALIVDGEAFVQLVVTEAGPRLLHLPAELVDESMTRPTDGGGYIVQGIEHDATGQRVAYHVFPARPDLLQTYAQPVRIPADEILHVVEPLAAGQVRGIPWTAPIILPASELDQLTDALLVGTKVAAMFAGFLVNQNDMGAPDPFADEMPSLEPGTLQRLPGGHDVRFATPQQAQQTGEFVRAQIRSLAAGLGVPAHWLDGDLSGANYSSLRAGLLPVRARCEQVQYLTLVPQLLAPVWREVVTWAALVGDLPGFEDDPRAALAADWLPPAWQQVDPQKQINADIAELEAGLTSRRKLVAQRGWPLEDLDAELAAEAATAPKENPDA